MSKQDNFLFALFVRCLAMSNLRHLRWCFSGITWSSRHVWELKEQTRKTQRKTLRPTVQVGPVSIELCWSTRVLAQQIWTCYAPELFFINLILKLCFYLLQGIFWKFNFKQYVYLSLSLDCSTLWPFHVVITSIVLKIDQNNYRTMRFMSKQVSLPKISLILQKIKIDPKTDIYNYALFAWRPSIAKEAIRYTHGRPFCSAAISVLACTSIQIVY